MFYVISIALLTSWLVAGTATPLFGYLFIKVKPHAGGHGHDIYNTPLYNKFRRILDWCLSHRTIMLGGTVTCFVLGVLLLGQITQQFFPSSTRPELIVQLKLQEGASLANTEEVAREFAQRINGEPGIDYYTYHVGEGSPRFVLTITPELQQTLSPKITRCATNCGPNTPNC